MDQPPVHPLLDRHRLKNVASRDLWQFFTQHRRRVTDLLIEAAGDAVEPRLVGLGAGNCNDLDLPCLRAQFAAIDLVDWDTEAVLQGIARQGLASDTAIRSIGPIDLAALAESISAAEQPSDLTLPPADVVASICLLSQILDDLAAAISPTDPQYLSRVQQVRQNHLQLLVSLLKPGGIGLFIIDLVSSDTAPQIISESPLTLPQLLKGLIDQGNFFTGLNPAVSHSLLTTDAQLARQVTDVTISQPWLWDFSQRVYAVYAARFRRVTVS